MLQKSLNTQEKNNIMCIFQVIARQFDFESNTFSLMVCYLPLQLQWLIIYSRKASAWKLHLIIVPCTRHQFLCHFKCENSFSYDICNNCTTYNDTIVSDKIIGALYWTTAHDSIQDQFHHSPPQASSLSLRDTKWLMQSTIMRDRCDNVATLICTPPTCLGSSACFMSLIKHFQHCRHHLATQI